MSRLPMPRRAFHRQRLLGQPVGCPRTSASSPAWLTKITALRSTLPPKAPNIGAGMHRLRRRDRGVGVAHLRHDDAAADQHHLGLGAEEGGRPQHQIGALALLDCCRYGADIPCAMAGLMVYFAT